MQGHNDTPAVFRDNGARESQGTLTYDSVYAGPPEPPPKPADPYPSASNIRIVNDCSETVHINIRWQQPGIEPWQNSAWNISSGESTYLNATNIGRVKTNIIPVYYYAFSYPNLEWKEPIDTARHKITVTRNDSKMERGMKRFDAPKDNSDATIRLTCGK
jgi:hypothetical protein